jgi:S1-C subfamily serine protease
MVMRRTLSLLLAAAALAAAGVHVAAAHTSRAASENGIVIVNTNLAFQDGAAAGTGMVVTSDGEVLTNNHVIRGATSIRVRIPQTNRTYSASVLGYDPTHDVALLRLKNASGLTTVSTGDSSKLARGQKVTAIGNAGGTGALTVTTGTITGLHRSIKVNDEEGGTMQLSDLVETDAALHPGDSGGPLLDSSGRVIGMDSAASEGFSFQTGRSDGYAIPIGTALAIAKQIAAAHPSGSVHVGTTAFLGVSIDASGSFNSGWLDSRGVVIGGVVPGSPASKAGLSTGDVITALNGRAVASQNGLVALLLPHHPGDKVSVRWIDQLQTSHSASVQLASGPPQ